MPQRRKLAIAIARCEGFFVPGSLPARCHNPGDLELGDRGHGVDAGKTIFACDDDGWQALENELSLIARGHSHYYNLQTPLVEFAATWSGRDPHYVEMLTEILGVPQTAFLGDILNEYLA